jgi:hypothetical protein
MAAPRKSMPGGFLSISANGKTNGIVWASIEKTNGMWDGNASSRLIAYDATDLHELWRDDTQVTFAKFTAPTIGDGMVFRPTFDNQIIVYGPKAAPAGSNGWTPFGGPADKLYIGGYGQFATGPNGGSIWRNDSSNWDHWTQVGASGAEFAVNNVGLYGVDPGHDGLFMFNGAPNAWTWIRGATQEVIAGGNSVYATDPGNAAIYWYDYLTEDDTDGTCGGVSKTKTATWVKIGNAGKQWVATNNHLYGLTPNGGAVFEYSGTPNVWYQIGGPAAKLFAGPNGLYATDPNTGYIFQYNEGSPMSWTQIGSPGYDFAADSATLYGLTPDRQSLFRYTGTPNQWTWVHGPANAVYAGGDHVAVVDPSTQNLLEYTSR